MNSQPSLSVSTQKKIIKLNKCSLSIFRLFIHVHSTGQCVCVCVRLFFLCWLREKTCFASHTQYGLKPPKMWISISLSFSSAFHAHSFMTFHRMGLDFLYEEFYTSTLTLPYKIKTKQLFFTGFLPKFVHCQPNEIIHKSDNLRLSNETNAIQLILRHISIHFKRDNSLPMNEFRVYVERKRFSRSVIATEFFSNPTIWICSAKMNVT